MREIALDTETTGLSVDDGHRLIEIGCVEMEGSEITGNTAHWYVHPQRLVPASAVAIHGLDDAFLSSKPPFGDIAGAFLDFIGDSRLIIHNAPFDLSFLNMELTAAQKPPIDTERVCDTLPLARKKFPQASLDALCRRFSISLSDRDKHGALLDARLLAQVYPYLLGRKVQRGLDLSPKATQTRRGDFSRRTPRVQECTKQEEEAHQRMLQDMDNPLWQAWKEGGGNGAASA